jgi:hypothetical protein
MGKIFSNIIFPYQKCNLQIGEDPNNDDYQSKGVEIGEINILTHFCAFGSNMFKKS